MPRWNGFGKASLRKLGDNDFIVERKGVSARQGAGTLERVVKYGQEAFIKALDYLASGSSDGEDEFFFTFF